jgi:hypothetical protein
MRSRTGRVRPDFGLKIDRAKENSVSDNWLDKAEQRLSSGNQRSALKEFEHAFYNPKYVNGGEGEILARGRQMRPKVTGRYEAAWDRLLTLLEHRVAREELEQEARSVAPESATVACDTETASTSHPLPNVLAISPTDAPTQEAAARQARVARPRVHAQTPTMKTCPDCAEDVREKARICRYCGYQFAKACPDCAEEVQGGARKCRHCGYRFAPPVSETEGLGMEQVAVRPEDPPRRSDVA